MEQTPAAVFLPLAPWKPTTPWGTQFIADGGGTYDIMTGVEGLGLKDARVSVATRLISTHHLHPQSSTFGRASHWLQEAF